MIGTEDAKIFFLSIKLSVYDINRKKNYDTLQRHVLTIDSQIVDHATVMIKDFLVKNHYMTQLQMRYYLQLYGSSKRH